MEASFSRLFFFFFLLFFSSSTLLLLFAFSQSWLVGFPLHNPHLTTSSTDSGNLAKTPILASPHLVHLLQYPLPLSHLASSSSVRRQFASAPCSILRQDCPSWSSRRSVLHPSYNLPPEPVFQGMPSNTDYRCTRRTLNLSAPARDVGAFMDLSSTGGIS